MKGSALLLIFVSTIVSAQIKTYKLGELEGSSAAGASISVSPRNNKNIVAYAAGKLYVSNDAGATWKVSQLQFPDEVKGTPKLVADIKGNFTVVYSTFDQIISRHSSDDGRSWGEPVIIAAAAGRHQYNPGITAHPKKEDIMVTWTQSGRVGMDSDTCKSTIMMSSSGNGGKKWSKPITVNQNPGNCMDEDSTVRGSLPVISADNKVFITWAGQNSMFYDRSYDGEMWISTDLPITEQVGGWALTIPGFGKIANTPVIAVDNSASRMHGTLFLAYSDLESGADDADIWLARSVNRGDNWTAAARINQDKPGHAQFLPRVCVDPITSFVYLLYYDRRDYSDNQTDVYIAWSSDGGNQFKERKLTEKPFVADINSSDYLTDLIGLSVHKGLIVPVWTSSENGKQQVWTAALTQDDLTTAAATDKPTDK